jgi:hypothetical protein
LEEERSVPGRGGFMSQQSVKQSKKVARNVSSAQHRVARYAEAQALIHRWEQRPARLHDPPPSHAYNGGRGRPSRVAMPTRTTEAMQYLQVSAGKIERAWHWVWVVEQYPQLAPPGVTQQRALQIGRVLAVFPPSEHADMIEQLRLLPTQAFRMAVREYLQKARQQARRYHQVHPTPPRVMRKMTGASWRKKIAQVRQHLLQLRRTGLIENLAATWTSDNLQSYMRELDHVIAELTEVSARMRSVIRDA